MVFVSVVVLEVVEPVMFRVPSFDHQTFVVQSGGLEEKKSFLSEGAYEKEGSDDLYRFPQIVHERKPQMVVQGGLEDLWVIHTSSIGSRGHS